MNLELEHLSREFLVYIAVGGLGFAGLSTVLENLGAAVPVVLAVGMVFGWTVHILEQRLKARRDARRTDSSDAAEGVIQ